MSNEKTTSAARALSDLPEREPLAIVYTDVVGSTAMNRSLGDEQARQLMRAHDRIVRSASRRHDGVELQPTGDGFKLVFPSAIDAVRATTEMQSEFEKHGDRRGPPIEVRMGIHFGTPLHEEGDIYGEAVILAARVMGRAGAQQILVSEVLRDAARGDEEHDFVDCGRYHLKGFEEGFRLFEVSSPHMSSRRRPVGSVSVPLSRPWQGSSFVGRRDELRALERALDAAEAGESRVAVLEGEAGIGKSRLAFEFVHAFAKRIGVIASTRCFPDLGGPYQPIVDLLVDLKAHLPELELSREDAMALAGLGHLAAELKEWLGESEAVDSFVSPEQEKPRLYAALVRVLLGIAQDRTLVLVIDDVQWADDETLDLLRILGRQLGQGIRASRARLLVIAMYREEGRPTSAAFRSTFSDLERDRLVEHLIIPSLEEAELRPLLSDLCSGRPSASFVSHVQTRSGGNPYFAEEIASDIVGRSELHPADPNWRPPVEDEAVVPPGISAMLEQRIAALSPGTLDVLQTAQLLGTRFELDALASCCDRSRDEILHAIEEGYGAGLLFEEREDSSYAFHHSLVADVLDASLGASARRIRHARIASALAARHGDASGSHVDRIARHLVGAGARAPADQLLRYSSLAADRAIALHAYGDADRWCEAALSAIAKLPGHSARRRAELEAKRALALGRTGHLDDARALADSAIRTLARGRQPGEVAIACEAIASCLVLHARHLDALPYLERALECAGPEAMALRGRVLWHYATALDLTGRSEEMRTTADEILATASSLRSPELREHALLVHRNWHANHTTDVAQARSLTRRVLKSAERRGDVWDQTLLLESLGLFELSMVRIDAALEALDRALDLATDVGALAKIIDARGLRALCFTHRGEFGRVEEEWEKARSLVGQVPGSIHLGQFLWARTRARLWQGEFHGSPAARDTAYPGLEELETAELAVMGMIASETNAPHARDLVSAAGKRHPTDGVGLNWMLASQMLAAAWLNLDEVDEAMKWYPGLLPYHRTLSLTFPAVELARIAAAKGWWETSAKHFRTALSIAKREGLRPHHAIARFEQARMWTAQGSPGLQSRAERALAEASQALEELGMRGVAQRFVDLRASDGFD